jgi:hypothetical protein
MPTDSAEGFIRRILALSLPGRLLSELAPCSRWCVKSTSSSPARTSGSRPWPARTNGPSLQTLPRVGPVTAAACVAALDDAGRFATAHQVEASLGLVPRE